MKMQTNKEQAALGVLPKILFNIQCNKSASSRALSSAEDAGDSPMLKIFRG